MLNFRTQAVWSKHTWNENFWHTPTFSLHTTIQNNKNNKDSERLSVSQTAQAESQGEQM